MYSSCLLPPPLASPVFLVSKDALSGRLPGSFSSQLDPFVCSTVLFVCFGLGFALGVSSVSSVSSAELPVWAGIIYSCLAVSCVKLFVQMRLCVWKMFMNERDKWPNVSAVCVCVCLYAGYKNQNHCWANIYFSFFCSFIFAA